MSPKLSNSQYAFGSTDLEHMRLIRQAAALAPFTERFFREAGIGPGQRILDLGSGAGDVAMLAARLVGHTGSVLGIERDAHTIARARMRAAGAGFGNITFTQADVAGLEACGPFDAVVGRLILAFLPDPVTVLRSLMHVVRPGGVLAFQEVSNAVSLTLNAHLPLVSAAGVLVRDTLQRSGVNVEMGPALYRAFKEAELPPPSLKMEVLLVTDSWWMCSMVTSLLPQIERLGLSLRALGDIATLPNRLEEEVAMSNGAVAWLSLVNACAKLPA